MSEDIRFGIENWMRRSQLSFMTEHEREQAVETIATAIKENA